MKRTLSFVLAVLMLAVLLAGCGRTYNSGYRAEEKAYYEPEADIAYEDSDFDYGYAAMESNASALAPAPRPEPEAAELSAAVEEPERNPQKLIYTADLEMETLEFEAATEALAELTESVGGYFESSQRSDSGSYRWASYTVRVPADNYRLFLDQVGEGCHVLSLGENTEDVSEYYYDTAGRLETQRTKLGRLQELMEEAESMEDIIVLESAISDTEELIDMLSGTLRHYDALVAYSTVDIYLKEVKVYEPEPDPTYGERLGSAFTDGLKGFAEGMGDLLVVLAYGWLWLLLIAAAVVLVLLLTRKRRAEGRRLRAERKAAREAARTARSAQPVAYYTPSADSE